MGPGDSLGHYRIVSSLGAGGMGAVYRARDTTLNRDVAIKVLPDAFADDPERLSRFQREAQALAALNHPNIAQIYGLEGRAIVMELVEGRDLSELIGGPPEGSEGPALPLTDALAIARQIADALEAAHDKGIIHRDLKPANVKVTADGTVKVLDFGLAKALDARLSPESHAVSPATLPTMTSPAMTAMGMILGTAAYMSPEQAKGRPVDKRADIWAFGVVLYEMLTGRRLFEAESVAETLGLIFVREPDMAALPASGPRGLETLLRRCLEKDPKRRIRDMGDVRWHLDTLEAGGGSGSTGTERARHAPTRPGWQTWGAAVALALVAAAAAWFAKPASEPPSLRLSIALPPGERVTTAPAISPDGTTVAYVAGRSPSSARLYTRALDGFEATLVQGSEGAVYPFFSPDGESVAFFADAQVWRVPVSGGRPTSLASAPSAFGGTWTSDDSIIYTAGLNSGLLRIPAGGGSPEPLTTPDGAGAGYAHVFPKAVPGRSAVLFSFWGQTFYLALLDLETRTWRQAAQRGADAVVGQYATSGHVVAGDEGGSITAARFEFSQPGPAGMNTAVLDDAHVDLGRSQSWFDVSETGTLVYVPGRVSGRHVVWVDRSGQVDIVTPERDGYIATVVSRDGRRIASVVTGTLWIQDLATGARTRIEGGDMMWPSAWMPDGNRLLISSNHEGDWDLYTVETSGGLEWTPLLKKPHAQHPMDASPDGVVVYLERHPQTGSDLWTLAPDGDATPFAVGPFNQEEAKFSADGRWIAFVSNESGRKEVYVQPWPGPGVRVQVSAAGGTGPVWSPDGRDLLYREDASIVSVPVRFDSGFTFGERRRVLDMSDFDSGYFHEFEISADGERFLMIQSDPNARQSQLNIVTNWFRELRAKVR